MIIIQPTYMVDDPGLVDDVDPVSGIERFAELALPEDDSTEFEPEIGDYSAVEPAGAVAIFPADTFDTVTDVQIIVFRRADRSAFVAVFGDYTGLDDTVGAILNSVVYAESTSEPTPGDSPDSEAATEEPAATEEN